MEEKDDKKSKEKKQERKQQKKEKRKEELKEEEELTEEEKEKILLHLKRKKKRRKIKHIIFRFMELLFLIGAIYAGFKIYDWIQYHEKTRDVRNSLLEHVHIQEEVPDNRIRDKYRIDFAGLREKNKDVVAWIKVFTTNIEYPIVKANDNEFYLNHSFDKTYNTFGWVFANYQNKFDGSDKNISLFAHNMLDGSMFGTLKNTQTEEWQSNPANQKLILVTPQEISHYQIFSTYRIKDESYFFQNDFPSNNEYQEFLDTIKKRSNYDFGVEVNTLDKIITLATCDNDNNYRIVLHAKKVKD